MAAPENNSNLDFAYDFYKLVKKNKVAFAYEGEMTHEITKAFSSLAENHITLEKEAGVIQKRVFHVMLETLQNISKHSGEKTNAKLKLSGQGLLLVTQSDTEYNITTGNVILNENIPALTKHLDEINAGDKKILKDMYKKQIKTGKLSETGSAGLGFIDIARKTGEKLIYTIKELNDQKSYFVLTSTILRTK